MSQTAQMIFETAPLGATVAFSDGTPRPPDRFKHKLRAWEGRNASGRLVRKTSGSVAPPRPAAFTLKRIGLQSAGVIVLVVMNTFDVGSHLVFEVIDTPKPGEILCFIAHDDDLELRHVASDQYDAAA